MRSGAHALSLLSVPLNVDVLQALGEEPKPLVELRRAVGSPPQTTMRAHLRSLTETGVLARSRENDFPGSVDFQLEPSGRDLLAVAGLLQAWLGKAPDGPVALGSVAGKSTTKALVDGWSTGIVRLLAAKSLALTELSRIITGLSYPSLERRLVAMRLCGQIEPCPGNSRGTPYRVTEWLRRAVGPLTAAARWERKHLRAQTEPLRRLDFEAAFLLALPLLTLAAEDTGVCRLAVELRNREGEPRLVGVTATLTAGRVTSCSPRLEGDATTSIAGTGAEWLRAVTEGDSRATEASGDPDLAFRLLDALHRELFQVPQKALSASMRIP